MRAHGKMHQCFPRYPRLQRGQVILMTMLLLGFVVSISLFSLIRPRNPTVDDVAQTELALAQARDALLAYTSGRLTTNRPGELPCPDRNNNGTAETNCNTTANRIGRLPWSTLGIADLRDGSGERLWYAVSANFKNNAAVTPLNSTTPGQLTVTGIAPSSNVIAIVFAAGPVVSGQSRTTANVNNVAHFLESENANSDTTFATAATTSTFNDRLLAITPAMFFPSVEMRVAREARVTLNASFNNPSRGYYSFAHAYGGAGLCTPSTQGRIPTDPVNCGQQTWGASFPPWFFTNNWHQVLFYAVAPACTNPAAPNCGGAGGFLTVNGADNVRAAIISPGTTYTGQSRPCATISDCLEPPNSASYPAFTHVTGTATINDRVVIVSP